MCDESQTLSLESKGKKTREAKRGFMKMSASWVVAGRWQRWISVCSTESLTKYMSISTCLVQEWRIELALRCTAPRLSHHKVVGRGRAILSSCKGENNQIRSANFEPNFDIQPLYLNEI